MFDIRAELDLSEFYAARDHTRVLVRQTLWSAVTAAGTAGVAEAKAVGKFKDRTGALRSSIYAKTVVSDDLNVYADIVSPMPYSIYVEAGTKPHDIRPKAGHGTIGPLLHHKGSRPYPFAGPAFLKAEAVLQARIEDGVAQIEVLWR